jgi:hypothetical protein
MGVGVNVRRGEGLLSHEKERQAEKCEQAKHYADYYKDLFISSSVCTKSLGEKIVDEHRFPVPILDGDIVCFYVLTKIITGHLAPSGHACPDSDCKSSSDTCTNTCTEVHTNLLLFLKFLSVTILLSA